MAHVLRPDSIDFEAYMEETDTAHSVKSSSTYTEEVIDYFHGPKKNHGSTLPWGKTKDLIGFRPGEVTLWGGFNGAGKSLVLGQACVEFARQGKRVMIASLEMLPTTTLARMCRQEYGSQPVIEAIRAFHAWTDPLLWLYDQQGAVRPERMLAVLRYSADVLKVNHAVVDSLLKCGIADDDYTKQKHFIDQLCAIGRDSGMHIHLVAHSRKQKDEFSAPGKMDIKGTGSMSDQVDNIITVWRDKKKEMLAAQNGGIGSADPDTLLICDKQRTGEWEGKIGLWYSPGTMRFEQSPTSNF